ncbi:hypothetical protein CHS0354_017107 [Potamilus streckersoni]|uniref:Golgin subfamily A member 3 n=1 Tax=Potamilus streckersoni TaxID=2493646 RepID=A0AAE0VU69_9BIVA|nr:hypothetical protein CHS0354_017107 [Potamilus streckersoni]
MEPFELKLQQVNYIQDCQFPQNDLDSFSNVIHYDSHLPPSVPTTGVYSSTNALASPIAVYTTGNKIQQQPANIFSQPSKVKVTQIYNQSVWSEIPVCTPPHAHFLVNPDDKYSSTSLPSTPVTQSDIRTLLQVSSNTNSVRKHLHKKFSQLTFRMAEKGDNSDPLGDEQNVAAFETVAEALRLQWSVIGNKNITPAPPEVVAQIVAEAEKKLKAQKESTNVQNSIHPLAKGDSSATAQLNSLQSFSQSPPLQIGSLVSSRSPVAPTLEVSSDQRQPLKSSAFEPASVSKELFRQIPESIVASKDKKGWFGGDANVLKFVQGDVKTGSKLDPSDSQKLTSSGIVSSRGQMLTTSLSDSGSLHQDSLQDDNMSVTSSSSELDMYNDRETEIFLKTLPPVKNVDLKDFMTLSRRDIRHSPPVKETSFQPIIDLRKNNESAQESEYSSVYSTPGITSRDLISRGVLNSESRSSHFTPKLTPIFQSTPKLVTNFTSPQTKLSSKKESIKDMNHSSAQVEELLKEKAKLEGQLEMLTFEAQSTLQERAELQAQLASLKLKNLNTKGQQKDEASSSLLANLESLKQVRISLEQSLVETKRQLEEKAEETRSLLEELKQSQEISDKFQSRIKELRDEIKSRDMTIQALKNKIAELYVEVQTSLQSKMEADNEARSAKSDLVSLQNARQWYQQQLQSATQARSELQHELTNLQAQAVSQGSIIERLRAENTRLRQQLSETQQRALKEKELLARQLETIQADMMDREASFQEIQRERSFLEDTFATKIQTVEEEKSRIAALMQMTSDMDAQLDRANNDLKKKQSLIFTLENEQMDLMKKLTLSQESLIEKDKTIEELEQKLIEVESRLNAFQNSLVGKEVDILKIKEEKAAAEIALKSALEEKRTVDKALESLKLDMGKVEKSFKQMKLELNAKSAELEQLRSDKNESQTELEKLRQIFENEKRTLDNTTKEHEIKSAQITELHTQKVSLDSEVIMLQEKVSGLESMLENATKEKEFLDMELTATREKLTKMQQVSGPNKEEEALQRSEVKPETYSVEFSQLEEKNMQLKEQLAQVEKTTKKDNTKYKARIAKLNSDLKALQRELTERQQSFDTNVALLSSKLREVISEKEKLETELDMSHKKYELSVMEQQDQISTELQNLASELEQSRLQKQSLESQLIELQSVRELEIHHYQQELSSLQGEITRIQQEQADSTAAEEDNQKLALELEKERGRLAGLTQSNATLKQHVLQLEDALAQRESALVDIHSHLSESTKEREQEEHNYIKRIQILEENLQNEKDGQRDLRKQIGVKITENKKLKRQNESIKSEQEQLRQDVQQAKQEIGTLQSELDTNKQTQVNLQNQSKTLETENKSIKRELERVQQQLADNMARGPVIQEQIQSLQFQLSLKCSDLLAAQEQLRLSEERQQTEMNSIKQALLEKNLEIEELRSELATTRHDKLSQQAKMAELRSALKSSVQYHKMLRKLGSMKNNSNISDLNVELPPLPFDLDDMDKLLLDTAVRALESKPLDNLQSCLSKLRLEITGLQSQLESHTTTIETSVNNWSQLENQMKELNHVIQTIANTTMSTATTTSIAAAAVEAADRSTGVMEL